MCIADRRPAVEGRAVLTVTICSVWVHPAEGRGADGLGLVLARFGKSTPKTAVWWRPWHSLVLALRISHLQRPSSSRVLHHVRVCAEMIPEQ